MLVININLNYLHNLLIYILMLYSIHDYYIASHLTCECLFTYMLQELFITIQIAFPRVWRFAVCIFILFIAYLLSGWLVLGPYHPKVIIIICSSYVQYLVITCQLSIHKNEDSWKQMIHVTKKQNMFIYRQSKMLPSFNCLYQHLNIGITIIIVIRTYNI